jgi:hypothetical protein
LCQSGIGSGSSKRSFSPVTGANADHLFECRYENLAIADLSRSRPCGDRLKNLRNQVVGRQNRDLYFWKELNRVLGAPVNLGMPSLASEAPDLTYSDTFHSDAREAALYIVQLARPDNRINALHREPLCFLDSSAIIEG